MTTPVPQEGFGEVEDLRSRVVQACIYLLDSGLISGTWGMACARVGTGDRFVVTPSGMDYRTLSPGDLPVVGLDGRVISGTRRPSSETPMLARLLEMRPDIGAVAHTHSTVATGFAAAGQPIPVVLAELAEAAGGAVPCAQYASEPTGPPMRSWPPRVRPRVCSSGITE
jgi:L-ribulose-5-phosphate 4-epimerase